MNNNDHFNRHISSLHHGSELSFPSLMGLEHEDLAFNSYYSSMHNNAASNNNQILYRPYDNNSSNNSDVLNNGGGAVHSAGSLGNRNVLGNSSNASADLNQKISAWPHFPDTNYSHNPHSQNANFWPQLFQNNNVSQPNVHNYRHLSPSSNPLPFCLSDDDSNGSVYRVDVERSPLTSPDVIQTSPSAPTFPSDLFLTKQNCQQPFASLSNDVHQNHPLPIRPIPQQASKVSPTQNFPFVCSECGRYCSSSGGLKRHLESCHIIRAKLKNGNVNHIEDSESQSPYSVDNLPLNLSSDSRITRDLTKQSVADAMLIQCEPMNFSVNDVFPGAPLFTEENNNVIQSQSISTTPTISKIIMPGFVLTVPPIPDEKNPMVSPIVSNCLANGRKRKCPQCPLILHSERALVKHLVSHNIRKPYECRTCGGRFSRKFHMTRHMKQRGCDGSPRNQFECEFCGKYFSRKDNMHEHVKGHMGQTKQRIKLSCPVPMCEKKFTGKTQLQVHLNCHSGSRPYICNRDDCDKTFCSNAALKRHLRVHNEGKLFQCSQCVACFGTKHSLARHMNSHELKRSIRSYICCHCGLAFVDKKQLDDHVKSHLSTKPFECKLCDRIYKRHWRLQKHYKQIHQVNLGDESTSIVGDSALPDVEKSQFTYPHECDKCPKKFDKKHLLKAHYVTHFPETPLVCTECSRAYIRRDCLLRHLRTYHRLLPDEALETMKKMNPKPIPDEPVASLATDVELVDLTAISSCSNPMANEPQDAMSVMVGTEEIIDVSILEGNVIELLSLLVDPDVMRSFGWPNLSVDMILQSVLVKCGKEPLTMTHISLAQRLRGNIQRLFSFLVDDQTALENLFSRRPIEQVLQQVIELARNAGGSTNNIVQLPLI